MRPTPFPSREQLFLTSLPVLRFWSMRAALSVCFVECAVPIRPYTPHTSFSVPLPCFFYFTGRP